MMIGIDSEKKINLHYEQAPLISIHVISELQYEAALILD